MPDQHQEPAFHSSPPGSDAGRLGNPRIEHPSTEETFEFDLHAPRMVLIVWKDAESQGGPTWEDADEMLDFARRPLTPVTTVGVLLHLDDEQIAITDTVTTDQMGGVTKIPRAWVERFEILTPTAGIPTSVDQSTHPTAGRRVG